MEPTIEKIPPNHVETIEGVEFDTRLVLALYHLIAACGLFNEKDGKFAWQCGVDENENGTMERKEGPFYGRAWFAARDTWLEMGMTSAEWENATLVGEVTSAKAMRFIIGEILKERQDNDFLGLPIRDRCSPGGWLLATNLNDPLDCQGDS